MNFQGIRTLTNSNKTDLCLSNPADQIPSRILLIVYPVRNVPANKYLIHEKILKSTSCDYIEIIYIEFRAHTSRHFAMGDYFCVLLLSKRFIHGPACTRRSTSCYERQFAMPCTKPIYERSELLKRTSPPF